MLFLQKRYFRLQMTIQTKCTLILKEKENVGVLDEVIDDNHTQEESAEQTSISEGSPSAEVVEETVQETNIPQQPELNNRGGSEICTPEEASVSTGQELRRGKRVKIPSSILADYVTYSEQYRPPVSKSSPGSTPSSGKPYMLEHCVSSKNFSLSHQALLASIDAHTEPRSYAEAMRHSCWRKAMREEINALEMNGTWTVTNLPPGKRAIGSKWVYRVKHKSDGTIERYKARLVILGNKQVKSIDYTETFAPVIKI